MLYYLYAAIVAVASVAIVPGWNKYCGVIENDEGPKYKCMAIRLGSMLDYLLIKWTLHETIFPI